MKKTLCLLLILVFFPLFPGVAEQEMTIVASFYPVYIMAQNVLSGVENVNLVSMTAPATGCLHDYQLLTGDMRTLSRADAFLVNGAGMEDAFLPKITAQFPDLPLVDCSVGVELICGDAHHHDHHDHHGHEEGHEEEAYNAHIWLSPRNAMQMVENLRDGLSALLPHAADQIALNAENYLARLKNVDLALQDALSALPNRQMITFHEAFPYFARDYGLEILAVVALEPDAPLSIRMLEEVIETVQEAGNPPLFAEPQYNSAALRVISQETGARVYELDPFVTGEETLTAYEEAMQKNLQTLLYALSGD